jgi:hypothetical protein
MTARVAIPVLLARLRLVVDVGTHWNPVDRLILWALHEAPRPPSALADEVDLPPRLVNEMVFKLMQFGWAELSEDRRAVQVTAAGIRALHVPDGLPSIAWPDERSVRAVIEPIEGGVFPGGEVRVYHANDLKELEKEHALRRIELSTPMGQPRVEELDAVARACLLNPDEDYVRIVPERSRVSPRFLVVTVHGKEVEGLPADAPAGLVTAIRDAAESPSGEPHVTTGHARRVSERPVVRGVAFKSEDVLLDGADHRSLISHILRKAAHRVVVHSTFLSLTGFEALQEDFRAAARKGALIDILYGADKDETTRQKNREHALKIAEAIRSDLKLRSRATMHLRSTQSHAKLIVADTGREDSFVAVVGSCNWLSTPYRRVESSVVLRDGRLVGQILRGMSEMCFATIRQAQLVGELDQWGRHAERCRREEGHGVVRLVLGDEHGVMMRRARDTAGASIWVGADRFGQAAEVRTLIPMMAAGREGVAGRVLFSRSVRLTEKDMADLEMEAMQSGVALWAVPEGVLHGKFLLWDDDDALITSLNWSSAVTRSDNPWGEMGVHLSLPGLASGLRGRLETSLQAAQEAKVEYREKRDRRRRLRG